MWQGFSNASMIDLIYAASVVRDSNYDIIILDKCERTNNTHTHILKFYEDELR